MTTITKALAQGTIGTLAAGALAVASASPAHARDRDRGISTGEVIAGAVILGGIAAVIAGSKKRDRDGYHYRDRDYRDRDYRDRNYRDRRHRDRGHRDDYRHDPSRVAVQECIRAAERQARRWSGSRAEVYEIRDIDRERGGFEIKGRIAVRDGNRGRGYRGDYRRGYRNNGWDEGRFTCDWRRGRVVDVDFRGLRSI